MQYLKENRFKVLIQIIYLVFKMEIHGDRCMEICIYVTTAFFSMFSKVYLLGLKKNKFEKLIF